jgi:hypothetical protein
MGALSIQVKDLIQSVAWLDLINRGVDCRVRYGRCGTTQVTRGII